MNSVPKYVASTTLTEVGWSGTTVLGGDLEEKLVQIRTELGKEVLVLGSPTLVRWLLAHELLDALTFTVLPIMVGSGVRRFEDMALPSGHMGMHLNAALPLASGALELSYTFA